MQKDTSGLVAIILSALVFVGTGVWWYFSYDEVMNEQTGLKKQLKEAREARNQAEEKLDKMTRQGDQLADLVGMNATIDGRPSVKAMIEHLNLWAVRLGTTPCKTKYGSWMQDPDSLEIKVGGSAEAGGRDLCYLKDSRASAETRMANETADVQQYLVAELENMTAALLAEAQTWENEAVRAITTHNENVGDGKSQGKLGTLIEEKTRRIKELREAIRNIEEQIASNQKNSEQAIADLEKDVRTKLDDLDQMKAKQEKVVADKRARIQELQDRVFAISTKRQLARESTEADGMVINSIPNELTAWIDIGRKDALLKGTIFEVFAMNKGGRKENKGKAVVISVNEDYAVISLLRDGIVQMLDGTVYEGKVVEKGNVVEITERNGNKLMIPADRVKRLDYYQDFGRIEKGDYVANEVFDRKKSKTFVFGGKLRGRYTNEQMTHLIEEFGGEVDAEVQSETTYLVVGADFEKDPNFDKAKNLAVKIIREADLYEMLGVSR
ncbi:MAG: BRCT domain-containing protein [Planctomycetota bacterium]